MIQVLAIITAALLAVALHDVIRRPLLRRQALRNLVRRPTETMIVIGGALLGTAIITASFVIGDTIDGSIRSIARTDYGQIDETIVVEDASDLPAVLETLDAASLPSIDGVLTVSTAEAVVASLTDDTALAESGVFVYEVEFPEARRFGSSITDTGFHNAGPTPAAGHATMSSPLADTLDVKPGDTVDVVAFGLQQQVVIDSVLPRVGLAGRSADNIYVAPGTLQQWHSRAGPDVDPVIGLIYVSNVGGVFDGVDATDTVVAAAAARVGAMDGVEIFDVKHDLLADADAEGRDLTTVFSSIGAFAVISGILLVINIVTMLTEERRSQLGILRALGLERNHLVRMMALEGTGYALLATPIGVALGVGVGWVVGLMARSLVAGDGLDLRFAVDTESLVIGGVVGLLITLTTVWIASIRVARLNVISAIRDLPDTTRRRRRGVRAVGGLASAALGGALLAAGVSGSSPVPTLIGVPIAAFGLVWMASPRLRRPALTVAAALSLVWGVGVFTILPDAMAGPDIDVFVFQGVVLVTAAVTLLTVNSGIWRAALAVLGRGAAAVPVRLGLTYPLAKPGRTGLLLGMYSLVIFTITFMAAMVSVFQSQAGDLARQAGGGYELIVDSSSANPPTIEEFLAIDGVTGSTELDRGWTDIAAGTAVASAPVTGIETSFAAHGGPELSDLDPTFGSDRAAWSAVADGGDFAVASEFLFEDDGEMLTVGSELQLLDDLGRPTRTVTIIGLVANDWVWNGLYVSADAAATVNGPLNSAPRHYLDLAAGVDPAVAAAEVNAALLTSGVDARAFQVDIDEELAGQEGFIKILQGYLGLGLLIGVAGLGIVLVRAVRERRREIGMLRAMGYGSRTVRRAFLVEALFIAGQGALIGVALGLVSAWQVVTKADAFGAGSPSFVIPVVATAIIGIGPVLASMLAAVGPARRAAAIDPAVALRVTG